MIFAAYLCAASTTTVWGNGEFLTIWMAFIPGVPDWVTFLALIFGLEVAFVAFHLTVSVVTIFMNMPLIFRTLSGKRAAIFLKI